MHVVASTVVAVAAAVFCRLFCGPQLLQCRWTGPNCNVCASQFYVCWLLDCCLCVVKSARCACMGFASICGHLVCARLQAGTACIVGNQVCWLLAAFAMAGLSVLIVVYCWQQGCSLAPNSSLLFAVFGTDAQGQDVVLAVCTLFPCLANFYCGVPQFAAVVCVLVAWCNTC